MIIKKLIRSFKAHKNRDLFVDVDGADNSVTCSKRLLKKMKPMERDDVRILVFRVGEDYGFCFLTDSEQAMKQNSVQAGELSLNTKYNCIGFESLNPTVNRMLYKYGLVSGKYRLSVTEHRSNGLRYWRIERPPIDTR